MFYSPTFRKWYHTPKGLAKAGGLATTIAEGNFRTRNFRQKPIVVLQTGKHISEKNYIEPTKYRRNPRGYGKINLLPISTKPMVKRTTKKKTSKKSKAVVRKKLPSLMVPRSHVVRFRMVVPYAWTSAGAIAVVTAKANSLNDPSAGFGAGLPLGLDQWAAQYQKYIVLGSKITVRASNTTNTGMGVIGIHLSDSASALANTSHYKELPLTRQKLLTTQKDFVSVSNYYKAKKFWRLTNIRDDSEQEAVFSTTPGDPTDIAYYHVYMGDLVGANNFNADLQIEMEFICLLTDPVTLAQSSL